MKKGFLKKMGLDEKVIRIQPLTFFHLDSIERVVDYKSPLVRMDIDVREGNPVQFKMNTTTFVSLIYRAAEDGLPLCYEYVKNILPFITIADFMNNGLIKIIPVDKDSVDKQKIIERLDKENFRLETELEKYDLE
jgi:hypothetical protein